MLELKFCNRTRESRDLRVTHSSYDSPMTHHDVPTESVRRLVISGGECFRLFLLLIVQLASHSDRFALRRVHIPSHIAKSTGRALSPGKCTARQSPIANLGSSKLKGRSGGWSGYVLREEIGGTAEICPSFLPVSTQPFRQGLSSYLGGAGGVGRVIHVEIGQIGQTELRHARLEYSHVRIELGL